MSNTHLLDHLDFANMQKNTKASAAPRNNVVNIMDALRKSVEADLKVRKAA